MKSSIRAVVLHLQVYYCPWYLLSFAETDRTVVAFAFISRHGCSPRASYGTDSQEETPSQNVPEPWASITYGLHRAHWDYANWGGSWFACGRFTPFLPATRLKSQRLWMSCAYRCQKVRRLKSAGVQSGVNVLLSRPNGQACCAQQYQRFVLKGARATLK